MHDDVAKCVRRRKENASKGEEALRGTQHRSPRSIKHRAGGRSQKGAGVSAGVDVLSGETTGKPGREKRLKAVIKAPGAQCGRGLVEASPLLG